MSKERIFYVCLDDKASDVEHTTRSLERHTRTLKISTLHPAMFEKQIGALRNCSRQDKLDGLIIDLRLDESPNAAGERVTYSAQSVAQQLRTLMAQDKLDDFPIVLWTIDLRNLERFYKPDRTSYDLFDHILSKRDAQRDEVTVGQQLVSLVLGYRAILESLGSRSPTERLRQMLNVPSTFELDSRIFAEFTGKQSAHIYARFILHEMIKHPGPLVDEELLFARLGVDIHSKDKNELLGILTKRAVYEGPFSDAWRRWWWPLVEAWWKTLSSNVAPMISLPAEERVAIIVKRLDLVLTPAKRIDAGYRTFYSTVCQALHKPLDPIDGFVIATRPLRPWQDRLYVSAKAAVSPGKTGFKGELDPSEKERLQVLRTEQRKTREG
jgi:hypothetical protein